MVCLLMGLEFASRFAGATALLRGASGRRRIAFGVHTLFAGGAIGALAAGVVASRAPNVALLVPLAVAGVLAEVREVRLVNGIGVDASVAVALVALVAWGPLPALMLLVVSIAGGSLAAGANPARATLRMRLRAVRRDLWRPGNLANLGSAGCSLLAGGAVLANIAPASGSGGPNALAFAAAVLLAGAIANVVQFLSGPLVHWTLWYGRSIEETLTAARGAALVEGALVLLGAATAVLVGYSGTVALVLLAPVVLLPLFIGDPARAKAASELSHAAATRLYADALAAVLDMPRCLRRNIPNVLGELRLLRTSGLLAEIECSEVLDASTLKLVTRRDDCLYAAWTVDEHWDGTGPARIGGERLPLIARVLAVAEEWARWTAADGPHLSHQAALSEMHALSGRRLDPFVLASAQRVIEREGRVTPEAACQPRLHNRRARLRIYLPYAVAPAMLSELAQPA